MRTTGSVIPKNTSKREPINIDPARSRTLLIATRRASTLRSSSVQEDVKARKIGAVPIGFKIGNNPANTSGKALAKAVITRRDHAAEVALLLAS
jgi:hypothetical protein